MTTYEIIVSRDLSDGEAVATEASGPDDLMRLETAVWAPEIRGPFLPAFSTAQLRAAIAAGKLKAFRPGHAILVTRRGLSEWRDAGWERSDRGQASTTTSTETATTSATTTRPASASRSDLDTARLIAQRLRKPTRST